MIKQRTMGPEINGLPIEKPKKGTSTKKTEKNQDTFKVIWPLEKGSIICTAFSSLLESISKQNSSSFFYLSLNPARST